MQKFAVDVAAAAADNSLRDYNVAVAVVEVEDEAVVEGAADVDVLLVEHDFEFVAVDVAVVAAAVANNIRHPRFSSSSEADSAMLSAAVAQLTYLLIFSLTKHHCTTSFVLSIIGTCSELPEVHPSAELSLEFPNCRWIQPV